MRISAFHLFAATLLLSLAAAPFASPQATAPQSFREKRLGFSFTVPAGMAPQPGAEALLADARRQATVPGDSLALECLTIPLRLKSPGDKPYERFLFFVTDFGCLARDFDPVHVPSFTAGSMEDLVKGYGTHADGRGAFYVLDNHDADWETLAVAADSVQPGLVLYTAQTCLAVERSFACWNFVTSDRTRLHMLSDIQFRMDGHPAKNLAPHLKLRPVVRAVP